MKRQKIRALAELIDASETLALRSQQLLTTKAIPDLEADDIQESIYELVHTIKAIEGRDV
jgi:hypothetical protein